MNTLNALKYILKKFIQRKSAWRKNRNKYYSFRKISSSIFIHQFETVKKNWLQLRYYVSVAPLLIRMFVQWLLEGLRHKRTTIEFNKRNYLSELSVWLECSEIFGKKWKICLHWHAGFMFKPMKIWEISALRYDI